MPGRKKRGCEPARPRLVAAAHRLPVAAYFAVAIRAERAGRLGPRGMTVLSDAAGVCRRHRTPGPGVPVLEPDRLYVDLTSSSLACSLWTMLSLLETGAQRHPAVLKAV